MRELHQCAVDFVLCWRASMGTRHARASSMVMRSRRHELRSRRSNASSRAGIDGGSPETVQSAGCPLPHRRLHPRGDPAPVETLERYSSDTGGRANRTLARTRPSPPGLLVIVERAAGAERVIAHGEMSVDCAPACDLS